MSSLSTDRMALARMYLATLHIPIGLTPDHLSRAISCRVTGETRKSLTHNVFTLHELKSNKPQHVCNLRYPNV